MDAIESGIVLKKLLDEIVGLLSVSFGEPGKSSGPKAYGNLLLLSRLTEFVS